MADDQLTFAAIPDSPKFLNMTGKEFGQWTVLGLSHSVPRKFGRSFYWHCRCACGTVKPISGHNLGRGSLSCGCARSVNGDAHITHPNEYRIYAGMKGRCYRKTHSKYADYGGRGIRVCERWMSSFFAFLEDMGPRPSKKYSIDRKDNDGDYTPENCRWATKKEQNNNRRVTTFLTFNGVKKSLSEWSEITGIRQTTLKGRLKRGLPVNLILAAKNRIPGSRAAS